MAKPPKNQRLSKRLYQTIATRHIADKINAIAGK